MEYACEAFASTDEFFACTCDCELDAENDDDVALVQAALEAASDRLALLSAHTVTGTCEQTVTVCVCDCRGRCCCDLNRIDLPGPIIEISSIEARDPEAWSYVFDADDFVIVDDHAVAWTPGSTKTWPKGVYLDITYTFNPPVDATAKDAAIEIACAAVKKCRGVANIIGPNPGSVTRGGISLVRQSVSAVSNIQGIAAGQLPFLAAFLAQYNPSGAVQAPWIYSADLDEVHVLRPLAVT